MASPECDLRGYDFMPLFGHRLFSSAFYAKALRNPRAGLAAIKLWWAAWQQCPAGSLPSDDDELCHLADFGTDVKEWMKVRNLALHGFVKCSDGRLYHAILCEEAKTAFDRRRKERERKAKMRAAKTENSGGNTESVPQDVPRDKAGTVIGLAAGSPTGRDADVRADRTGQNRTGQKKKKESSLRSLGDSASDFDRWWAAYPRKVGKGAAVRAYASAVRKAPPDTLLSALTAYRFDSREQFIPHPATWLNGERWLDEIDTFDPVLRAAGLSPEDFALSEFASMELH
jgi:hypothetical protein